MKPGPNPKHPDERRRTNDTGEQITNLGAMQPTGDANDLLLAIMEPIVVPDVDGVWAEMPEPDANGTITFDPNEQTVGWHPLAQQMWEAMQRSGQVVFWEPTDWMLAVTFCEQLSRELKPVIIASFPATEHSEQVVVRDTIPMKGASLNALMKLAAQLGLSEGERRSMGMVLKRERDQRVQLATVTSADERRRQMAKGKSTGEASA